MTVALLKRCAWVLLLISGLAQANDKLTDPSVLILDTAGTILQTIEARRSEIEARPELAEEIVRKNLLPMMDVVYSARLILGRESRTASTEQLETFANAMNDQLIRKYASGILEFRSKEQIEVLERRGAMNPKATRVKTRVRLGSGGFALVDYVFRQTPDGWKVFDVIVEGISYIVSFQGQIRQEVKANGLDAVIHRLSSGELDLASG